MATATLEKDAATSRNVVPFIARWAVPARFLPNSSTDIGNDDTGTYRDDTEEADT